ncbi:MAG: FAD-binding and (Fe-S)-binding domain-containing protein [Desulfosarcinaceae bacterium]|nr:FAD-binding and (Fe-S)-binding domain-containing protein [Desulfosarcinaceae bacterium]
MAIATGSYQRFIEAVQASIPSKRIISDPLRTLAYGTDASFYRLIPRVVVQAESEAEVVTLLETAHHYGLPVTFRAAGTSLSGQAVTDSILLVAGDQWTRHRILDGGGRIGLQPGIIGAQANRYLAPLGKKIGPDPASINAAMIGGIAANNASGMCCGTAQNSYKTLDSIRIVLADGSVLDTGDPASRRAFAASHGELVDHVATLAAEVRANTDLAERIRHKYKLKNTTGYSLNALVDFEDPFDIIAHLMIGSEGTLGFISEVVYRTVPEHAHKASALMIFANIEDACRTVFFLQTVNVNAVELMDRAALRSVENKAGMPAFLKTLPATATALLVETRAENEDDLQYNVEMIIQALDGVPLTSTAGMETFSERSSFAPMKCAATHLPVQFTDVAAEYTLLWNIRKGLFPSVGAVRRSGTTVIIEDVAFPLKDLAAATLELQQLFRKYRYEEAILFGHALAGNLHFVFTQDFGQSAEVERYRAFMDDVCHMVVDRFDGSLKAEHGTGRNMAPYVELEWGADAYALMARIKTIFDPQGLLNPGVILTDNPQTHIENLKPMPSADDLVDKCIECGFCEVVCPSKNLSLTPRQRIVIQREIARLRRSCQNPQRLAELEAGYRYLGEQTCAVDGLCAISCPVDINTGDHTKKLRRSDVAGPMPQLLADLAGSHYEHVCALLRTGLRLANGLHHLVGARRMAVLADTARRLSGHRLPAWTPYMPRGIAAPAAVAPDAKLPRRAVYFPACLNQVMGPALGDPDQTPLHAVIGRVLRRAGYAVTLPPRGRIFCCGTPFESKGFQRQADRKAAELNRLLLDASRGGRDPILCDTSPCVYRLRQVLSPELQIYEPVGFIHTYLLDHLTITPCSERIAVHITCSSRKMGLEDAFHSVAGALAADAVFPDEISCCGWAGDRGFNFPELTAAALAPLRAALGNGCTSGYSNSRTCEIGLSQHSGIYYKSIFYLLDRCSRPQ